ncbi:hypothetical protein D3C79_782200 [compost metagenome]
MLKLSHTTRETRSFAANDVTVVNGLLAVHDGVRLRQHPVGRQRVLEVEVGRLDVPAVEYHQVPQAALLDPVHVERLAQVLPGEHQDCRPAVKVSPAAGVQVLLLQAEPALFVGDLLRILTAEAAPLTQGIFVRLVHDTTGQPVGLVGSLKLIRRDELEPELVVAALVASGAHVRNQVGQAVGCDGPARRHLNSRF